MKIYISARWQRRQEMQDYAKLLGEHECCSRWLSHKFDEYNHKPAPNGVLEISAAQDILDVIACDVFIGFTEQPEVYSTGGRHVELGVALALGKEIILIGPKENVFHHLPVAYSWCKDFDDALDVICLIQS